MTVAIEPSARPFRAPASRLQYRGGDTDLLSHAVRISFPGAGEAGRAAERFGAAARACWPAGVAYPDEGPRLWAEDVPAPASGLLAVRRRRAELTRVIGPGHQPPLRGVLLRYQDGPADLIVVCHRLFLPEAALRRLAGILLGSSGSPGRSGPGGPEWPEAPGVQAVPCGPPWAAPDWGLGDPRAGDRSASFRLRLDGAAPGDQETWLAAVAAVLARYSDDEPPAIAMVGPDGVPVLAVPGGADGQAPVAVGLVFTAEESAEPVEYLPCPAPIFPLTIAVAAEPGGASLHCFYRLRSFAPPIARQFARHVARAHRQVIESPRRGAGEVELLDSAELHRVAALGRPASSLRTRAACIHHLIAERARAHPGRPALSDGKQRLSYAELDERSDQMAHGLRALNVRDGDRVGVCMERCAELVVALLGVLKAGAVYVPMDPAYPGDRLSYTVTDAALRVVIGTPGEFPASGGERVITPGDLADLAAGCPQGPPASAVAGPDPAYVIYTSGSTGRPKGVVVPHANVAALIDATREEYQLGPSDVWTAFHSAAFDFSVWEIWGCLLTGGQLVVVPHWVSRSPDEFAILLAEEKVTVLSQTPSAFGQLLQVDCGEPRELAVRLIVFGGEPLDTRMLLPWFDRHPESSCRVVNMFGITETTVHVTAETITRQHALDRSRSVGRPLPGWHVYVMDSAQRMVPPGVAGEICVGGAGVSLGYLNRPELTSERFVPDPVTGLPMYRSGDKGRLRPDGTLEHLGRLDSQVKVRGFRIELDEIRNVLLEQPGVTAAAVVVNGTGDGDAGSARIDAYVVLAEGADAPSGLRRRLAGILPDYMVPATVTPLPALPLTTNGKLDAGKLPDPGVAAPDVARQESAGPTVTGEFARDLLAAWTHVLGRQTGPDDDFFELGGNSLCAVRIAAAMRDRGWPRIPIRDIYRNPTVRRLAASLGHPAR